MRLLTVTTTAPPCNPAISSSETEDFILEDSTITRRKMVMQTVRKRAKFELKKLSMAMEHEE